MSDYYLLIDSSKQSAQLVFNGEVSKNYVISTSAKGLGCAEGSYCTPYGRLKVSTKIGEGLPLDAILRSRIPTGEIWSSDPGNVLSKCDDDLVLTRILWLAGLDDDNANTEERFIYLHGTNQEHLLGTPASHGCVRFSNTDIVEIFNILDVGDIVEII